MALQLASAGARVKAFIPVLLGLTTRAGKNSTPARKHEPRDKPERTTVPSIAPTIFLSPEAEAALAPLDLPPDGPIDLNATLRGRLVPDVAARNFVSWARALDLVGHYSRRSIYTLYCEFSEVDDRPPLTSTRFLEALEQTEGIAKEQLRIGNGKVLRSWRWTIEPTRKAQAPEITAADARLPEVAAALCPVRAAPAPATPEPPASLLTSPKPTRSAIVLPRFVSDADHPFSPAGLRDREKSARRLRLNAAASRKQRGALRRAA